MTSEIKVFRVGGSVRDSFIGKSSNDIDFAIEAPSYAAMKEFILSKGADIFVEHPEFVTIRAKWRSIACDFTLCRKEGEYHDNRHPSSILPGTIFEDLKRRDFTMNAIAVDDESGGIIDPFNGATDIKNQLIRCVGNAHERFEEDALRILRALRFSICLGFEIHGSVWGALHDHFHLLDNISAERIRDELCKMFKANSEQSMKILNYFGRQGMQHIFNDRTKIWLEPTMKAK